MFIYGCFLALCPPNLRSECISQVLNMVSAVSSFLFGMVILTLRRITLPHNS